MAQTAVKAQHASLLAATADTVTLSNDGTTLVIKNHSTAAADVIYWTIAFGGASAAVPVSGADDTYRLNAGMLVEIPTLDKGSSIQVGLISAGTPSYSVEAY